MATSTIPYSHGNALYPVVLGSILDNSEHILTIPTSETHLIYLVATVSSKTAIIFAAAISTGYVRYTVVFNGGNDLTISTTGGNDNILKLKYSTSQYGVTVIDMPTSATAPPSYCTLT